jgi:DNA-binding NtrC family response regulator
LSTSLIHAELFGTEKGAFTGAYARRIGQIEAAHRGTVFLDEIGDLDPGLQGLLLRFLEEKSVRRLGGHEDIPVDVRVIAATNVDLESNVKNGRFRGDLYYRLNVIRVRMPPLRSRYEDIPLLAQTFLNRIAADHPRRIEGFTRLAMAAMASHEWPGNVRELLNRIRRAAILGEGRLIDAAQLELDEHLVPEIATLEQTRAEAERLALVKGLSYAQGNAREAADALGVSRATLYRLLEKHRVTPGQSDNSSPCL